MSRLLLIVILFLSGNSFAQVFKCSVAGFVTYSASPCLFGAVAFNQSALTVSSARPLSIPFSNGGFFSDGLVNGFPVRFHIDTGASHTTLTGVLAYQLGVRNCKPSGVSHTASGQAVFCTLHVNTLSVGHLAFNDVTVLVMPSMTGDSLLGMDLISTLHFSINNGLLILSR